MNNLFFHCREVKPAAAQVDAVKQFSKQVDEYRTCASLVVARYFFPSPLFGNCYFRSKLIVAIYCGYDQFLFVNSSQKNNLFASYLLNLLNISVPVAGVLTVSAIKICFKCCQYTHPFKNSQFCFNNLFLLILSFLRSNIFFS